MNDAQYVELTNCFNKIWLVLLLIIFWGSAYFWIGVSKMNDLELKNKLISEYGSDKFTMGLYCGILLTSIVIAIWLVAFCKFD